MRLRLVTLACFALIVPATAQAGGVEEPHFGFKATDTFLDLSWATFPSSYGGLVAVNTKDVCVQVEEPEGKTATTAELRRGTPGESRLIATFKLADMTAAEAETSELTGPLGCVKRRKISRSVLSTLRSKPARFYVEVNTTDMPDGAYGGALRKLRRR